MEETGRVVAAAAVILQTAVTGDVQVHFRIILPTSTTTEYTR